MQPAQFENQLPTAEMASDPSRGHPHIPISAGGRRFSISFVLTAGNAKGQSLKLWSDQLYRP